MARALIDWNQAVGTGLNTHPEFGERVREKLGLGEALLRQVAAADSGEDEGNGRGSPDVGVSSTHHTRPIRLPRSGARHHW